MSKRVRNLCEEDFRGWPGLSRTAQRALVLHQPATVFEARLIRGVGRKTTRRLLERNLLDDPEGCQKDVERWWNLLLERGLLEQYRGR